MPSRGEIWLVDLGMVQKARPALILNRAAGLRVWPPLEKDEKGVARHAFQQGTG